jgi:outer membrane lipoprotein-sorting protein
MEMAGNEWRAPIALVLIGIVVNVSALAAPRAHQTPRPLREVLTRMNDEARHLKTVSADLEYTHVTVVVDDHSTESGRFVMRNPKKPEMLVRFVKPDASTLLFKKNRLEIYRPRINQIVEYNLKSHSNVVQQFFLLGFGTDAKSLAAAYSMKLDREANLAGEATAVLDLAPRDSSMLRYFTRIQVWVSEESWLPVQQKFFSPDGDYSIARYSGVRVNESLPASTFRLAAAPGVERVKMN